MSRKRWGIVIGCVVLVVLCVLTVRNAVRWWTYEPWDDFRSVAATFPVPPDYKQVESDEIGERPAICDWKPSCEKAALKLFYARVSGTLDACSALQAGADQWEHLGFTRDVARGQPTRDAYPHMDPECIASGDIGTYGVQILSTDDNRATFSVRIG